jgi:hypothetical protein
LEEIIEDYDDLVENILSSNHSTFEPRLKQFFTFIDSDPIKRIVGSLPEVDFDEWYKEAKSTVESFLGSGDLDWPADLKENTSMHLSLLRKISDGQLSVPDFCIDFLYSDNNYDVMAMDFNEQIVSPLTSDIRKLVVRYLASTTEVQLTSLNTQSDETQWYQRPIGMIGIGLFVTILGGIVVSELTSVL